MNLKQTLLACAKMLRAKAHKFPEGSFTVDGKKVLYCEAANEIQRLSGWVFPDLDTADIQKVIHCKDCAHYKRYRKKNSYKPEFKCLCELDKKQREPDFFCADGKEKQV